MLRGDLKLRMGDAAGALEDGRAAERTAGAATVGSGTRSADATWRRALLLRVHARLVQGDTVTAQDTLDELAKGGATGEPSIDQDEVRLAQLRVLAVAGKTEDAAKLAVAMRPSPAAEPSFVAGAAAERALVLIQADHLGEAAALLDAAPQAAGSAFHVTGRLAFARAALELARGSERSLAQAEVAVKALSDPRALGGGAPVLVIEGTAVPAGRLETDADLLAGRAALRAGDEAKAQGSFDKAIAAAPRSPVPFVARATERLRRGEVAKGTADLDSALALAPDDPDVLERRAAVALAAQDAEKAIALLERAAARGGRDPYLHLDRSRAEELRGQHQAALAALERARELGLPAVCYAEARARIALGQGELETAEHWLDRLIEKRPFDLDALESRARVRAARGNLVQAAQDYGALRSLAPKVEYDRALARVAIDKGEFATARAVISGSLARAPKDAELHGLQGRLALHEKRYDDAEKELRLALSLNDSLSEATLDLALVNVALGAEGVEYLVQRAKVLQPEADAEGSVLRLCEELAGSNDNPESWFRAGKGARSLAEVNPKNHGAHAVVLKTNAARRDYQGLLEGSIRCLAAFPNDPDGIAARQTALKNGAKEGAFGGDAQSVPPVKQPDKTPPSNPTPRGR